MAQTWLDHTIIPLRVIIGDYKAEPTYTDERLHELMIVAATLVKQEISFTTSYTVSVPLLTITPDPVDDEDFRIFIVLKAACLADQSTFRAKALLEGIRAALGPASLSVAGNLKGFQYLLENGPCKTYQEMKTQYIFGNAAYVRAILSPFAGNNFDPSRLGGFSSNDRYRFPY